MGSLGRGMPIKTSAGRDIVNKLVVAWIIDLKGGNYVIVVVKVLNIGTECAKKRSFPH